MGIFGLHGLDAGIVLLYIAAVFTDVIQGFLIITFSVLLIPLGLSKIGGFAGLHAHVPDYMFKLFGPVSTSEYAWYTILAMVLANLVSIIASAPMMQTAGSARNENTARFGMIGGMFFKRILMIFWALAGLLAVGLFRGQLHDPDLIWGYMTLNLFFPGAIGLMLAGILAANMSTLSATSVTYSALFIRNLYQPFVRPKSERHLINVGRAVIIQIFICFAIYAVIPNLFQTMDWARKREAFLLETRPRVIVIQTGALEEDVRTGRARAVGEKIAKQHVIEPAAIFYEKVARIRPEDPESPKIGIGRFEAELWVLSWLGVDLTRFTKAQLVAARFFFDAIFPFVLLFVLSFLTRPVSRTDLERFFAKIHTPVQPTPALDEKAVEEAAARPERWVKRKIWPRSNWEIMKPGRADVLGFGGTRLLVGLVIFLLWLIVTIQ